MAGKDEGRADRRFNALGLAACLVPDSGSALAPAQGMWGHVGGRGAPLIPAEPRSGVSAPHSPVLLFLASGKGGATILFHVVFSEILQSSMG